MMKRSDAVAASLIAMFSPVLFAEQALENGRRDLIAFTLEELVNLPISSVSKRSEPLFDAPNSVYVITQLHIQNAGVTTLPEALRLAPTLHVARLTSSRYAISMRGFNNAVGNKLLVLIDGRTVYSPLFSGVFWDQQDVLMEDIDRIEVISGPGATLWGTNAVNGVINIITHDAADTVGGLAAAHAGNFEGGIRGRYGDRFGESGHYRIYGKAFEVDSSRFTTGGDRRDAATHGQFGFRTDWEGARDKLTLQGDTYKGETEERGEVAGIALGTLESSGTNVLGRWTRELNGGADLRLQAYWDYTKRRDVILFQPRTELFDIEVQHVMPIDDHHFTWGLGYRRAEDDVLPGFFATFVPDGRTLEWKNLFAMTDFQVTNRLETSVGLRIEHNDYTGSEYLPTLRFAWRRNTHSMLWGALSRAVRAPARYDRDVYYPAPPNSLVVGGPDFESEVANVLELGCRGLVSGRLSYSVTAYFHDWDKLRSGSAIPIEVENKIVGEVYGVEFLLTYAISTDWSLSAGGTRLHKDLRLKSDSTDPVGVNNDLLANDPDFYGQLRSTYLLSDHSTLEFAVRHVAELPSPAIPSYTVADMNYFWDVDEEWTISLTAQNAFDKVHPEFGRPGSTSEFGRMAWLGVTWMR